MKKYRNIIQKDRKEQKYNALIYEKIKDGTLAKIKRAEDLKGKLTVRPTDPKKLIELNLYASLEPILYLDPHKKLIKYINKVSGIKQSLTNENRPPTNAEIAMIAKYNEQMIKRANKAMNEAIENDPNVKNISSIEKARIGLQFIQMNEEPDHFLLLNRYFERSPKVVEEYTSDEEDLVKKKNSPLRYRKVQIGSKKDLQRSGILPRDDGVLVESPIINRDKSQSITQEPSLLSIPIPEGLKRKMTLLEMGRHQRS